VIYEYIYNIAVYLPDAHVPTIVTTVVALLMLFLLPLNRYTKRIPAPLWVSCSQGCRAGSIVIHCCTV
jgi:hypothetical protein